MGYFISGVWKTDNGTITHGFLHSHNELANTFSEGRKIAEAEVIRLIRAQNLVRTLRWDYSSAVWRIGARVIVAANPPYLRTISDATVTDNLDNMIKMNGLL